MTRMAAFRVEVHRVHPGCTVAIGTRSDIFDDRATVGRSTDANFRLDDRTVSGIHLEIYIEGESFAIRNASKRGSTFVQGRKLAAEEVAVAEDPAWIQVGRVLLQVASVPMTMPFEEPLPLPASIRDREQAPLLTLKQSRGRVELWFRGHAASLYPSAARVLASLASRAGEVITHSELDEAADPENYPRTGGASVPQLLTYVRTAFGDAIDEGWIGEEELLELVRAADSNAPEGPLQRAALMRALIQNIRGVGYRLRLPKHEIEELG